jgi:hypothetical protein
MAPEEHAEGPATVTRSRPLQWASRWQSGQSWGVWEGGSGGGCMVVNKPRTQDSDDSDPGAREAADGPGTVRG